MGDIQYSLRHGIPKIILCYDQWKSGVKEPRVEIAHPDQDENPISDDHSPETVPEQVAFNIF